MKCGELVLREGSLAFCGHEATHVAVTDWNFPAARLPVCAAHKTGVPCAGFIPLEGAPPSLRVVRTA